MASVLGQVANNNADMSQQNVLLHDGGGDRSQTIAALPRIIDGLRARGLKLVPVSALAGIPQAAVNPRVNGFDLVQVRADFAVFLLFAGLLWTIKWLFFVAIALGIARAILMAALAIKSRYDGKAPVAPAIDSQRFVSVLIPAIQRGNGHCRVDPARSR